MTSRRPLGPEFRWLWAGFAAATFGTWFAFDAFPLVAILVLHAGPASVSGLWAGGLIAGALGAVVLGPWVECQPKRAVMIAMDLTRFLALMSVPLTYALGCLTFIQLLAVSIVFAAANLMFKAASGVYLKSIVPPRDMIEANSRFEATTWTATAVGPPLGGAAFGLLGPMVTVIAEACSYLVSAAAVRASGAAKPQPARPATPQLHVKEMLEGWRYVIGTPSLRSLFFNSVLVNGLVMAISPLVAVLMLGRLGFSPWEYGLALGVPCLGGVFGSRFAPTLVERFQRPRVMLTTGVLRVLWPLGLAFIPAGTAGIAFVIAIQLVQTASTGVFNPVLAACRLEQTPSDRLARVLSAWSITNNALLGIMTGLWGVIASVTGPRDAITIAGVCLLATPLLLPWRQSAWQNKQARSGV